jgi:hypothetical protein
VRRDTRDLVHVSLELDQSTRVSHSIWSAPRCGPLRRCSSDAEQAVKGGADQEAGCFRP